uniref:Uncharacterized protein n=1 Tax=Rhizophora mucronata TaxID=61149 RepID=A0A2P2NPV2_RHIMU
MLLGNVYSLHSLRTK